MSQVATSVDHKAFLSGWVQNLAGMYCADIKAIPNEKLGTSPGGCARTPQQFSAEVVGLCKWTAAKLRGEEPVQRTEDEMQAFGTTMNSQDAICGAINAASTEFSEALMACPDDRLNSTVTPPWQMDAPLYMIALITANHIWYHDGQLNYLQALNGDEAIHWMPEA